MEEWEEEVDPFKVEGRERSDKVGGGGKTYATISVVLKGGSHYEEERIVGGQLRIASTGNSRDSSTKTLV